MKYTYSQPPRISAFEADRPTVLAHLAKALSGSGETNELASYLKDTIDLPKSTHRPITCHESDRHGLLWTTWHHGSSYQIFILGELDLMLACELTENERESLQLLARRAKIYGETTYIVASATVKAPPGVLPRSGLRCDGLVLCRLSD